MKIERKGVFPFIDFLFVFLIKYVSHVVKTYLIMNPKHTIVYSDNNNNFVTIMIVTVKFVKTFLQKM